MRMVITAMVIMFITGMAAWLVLYRNYSYMLTDIKRSEFKVPLIKSILKKYSDCKKLDISIRNGKAFVEKNIETYRIFGVSPETVEKLAKAMEYLIEMLAIVAAFFMRDKLDAVYICVTVGAVSGLALHLFGRLADVSKLKKLLIVELVDYIDNSGDLPQVNSSGVTELKKLTGKAYIDFVKLNKCYAKIQASGAKPQTGKEPEKSCC